jgi:hypothetical protein
MMAVLCKRIESALAGITRGRVALRVRPLQKNRPILNVTTFFFAAWKDKALNPFIYACPENPAPPALS